MWPYFENSVAQNGECYYFRRYVWQKSDGFFFGEALMLVCYLKNLPIYSIHLHCDCDAFHVEVSGNIISWLNGNELWTNYYFRWKYKSWSNRTCKISSAIATALPTERVVALITRVLHTSRKNSGILRKLPKRKCLANLKRQWSVVCVQSARTYGWRFVFFLIFIVNYYVV